MAAADIRPVSLKKDGDGLRITWDDGVATFVTWRVLRKQCPCATCADERAKPVNPLRVLTPQQAAAGPPVPVGMKPVGLYAYQISWNDGHTTGIYTVTSLRQLSTVVEPAAQ